MYLITKVDKTDGLEFLLYFAQSRVLYWVFLGTKMQKTKVLQNLLDFSGISRNFPGSKGPFLVVFVYKIDKSQFFLKYVPWIFLTFSMIPLIRKLVKVIVFFFFSGKFLLLPKLQYFGQSRLYANFVWENRKNVSQFLQNFCRAFQ